MCSQQSLPPGAGPVTVSTEISGKEMVGSDTQGLGTGALESGWCGSETNTY